MKKLILTAGAAFIFFQAAIAQQTQDTLWRYAFQTGLNFSQAAFNNNWTGGGINAVSLGAFLNYRNKFENENTVWRNEADLRYGFVRNQGEIAKKTTDRLFLDSKYGYKLTEIWNIYGSLNFLSQFADGYEYNDDGERTGQISSFMAPGYLTASLGLEYRPAEIFWLRFGPFTPRATFVLDEDLQGSYGVDPGESVRFEWLGLQIVSELNAELGDDVTFKARYDFFANYEQFTFDQFDHRLEMLFTSQITQFINVNLGAIILYDIDQIDGIQFSEALSLGLQYKISTLRE